KIEELEPSRAGCGQRELDDGDASVIMGIRERQRGAAAGLGYCRSGHRQHLIACIARIAILDLELPRQVVLHHRHCACFIVEDTDRVVKNRYELGGGRQLAPTAAREVEHPGIIERPGIEEAWRRSPDDDEAILPGIESRACEGAGRWHVGTAPPEVQ